MRPKVLIALPAYDEQHALPRLVKEIARSLDRAGLTWKVVAVDDGSTDRTAAVLQALSRDFPIDVVTHPRNLGLPAALRTALRTAVDRAEEGDVIVTMDADDTHSPELIPAMLHELDRGHDVVIASRYRRGARVLGVPLLRLVTSWGSAALFKVLLPVRGVRDYTCGYRAYRASLLRTMFDRHGEAFIDRPGFSCMADVLLKCARQGASIGEVPLVLRYDQKRSTSKMPVRRTVLETLELIRRERRARRSAP